MAVTVLTGPAVEAADALAGDVARRLRAEPLTLTQLCRGLAGAAPPEVRAVVLRAGLEHRLRAERHADRAAAHEVEPHPALFQWFFTEATRRMLATELASPARTLLLGVPSVAASLRGRAMERVLVDLDPYAKVRFPHARAAVLRRDVGHAAGPDARFDSVVFDAPWHEHEIMRWLDVAARACVRGGVVAFSLYGERTKPGARVERERVLARAERYGRVEVVPGALEYEVPPYELAAFRAAGVSISGEPWRLGDLVVLHRRSAQAGPQALPVPPEPAWDFVRIGTRVIARRKGGAAAPAPFRLATLDSISGRDPRRRFVSMWTSRNLVADERTAAWLWPLLASLARYRGVVAPERDSVRARFAGEER